MQSAAAAEAKSDIEQIAAEIRRVHTVAKATEMHEACRILRAD
jgi:hypothetical protein